MGRIPSRGDLLRGHRLGDNEPDKCAGWEWFTVGGLPEQMIGYARLALTLYAKGETYSERGFPE